MKLHWSLVDNYVHSISMFSGHWFWKALGTCVPWRKLKKQKVAWHSGWQWGWLDLKWPRLLHGCQVSWCQHHSANISWPYLILSPQTVVGTMNGSASTSKHHFHPKGWSANLARGSEMQKDSWVSWAYLTWRTGVHDAIRVPWHYYQWQVSKHLQTKYMAMLAFNLRASFPTWRRRRGCRLDT